MNTIKSVIGLVLASLVIGLGLLLLTGSTQIISINPAFAWIATLLGVYMVSSNYPGMRKLGVWVIAAGLYMGLRSADVIRLPLLRIAAGALLVVFGIITSIAGLKYSKEA